MAYEGTDKVSSFSGSVSSGTCHARFSGASGVEGYFRAGKQGGTITFSGPVAEAREASASDGLVTVSARLTEGWQLKREECSVYEARRWIDGDRQLHVRIDLDCTTASHVHVHGTVQSDSCEVSRP
ncbi:MAG TPA: hypothetical protein VIY73_06305 [Polyangiaceae bacterium]